MADPLQNLDDLISVLKGDRSERRNHARVKALRRGRIVYGVEPNAMRCFIVDISTTGARLRPAETEDLPDSFELHLEHDLSLQCDVIFRSESELGVSFHLAR